MDLEAIFKKQFPEYCAGNVCLSPYFDLFEAGAEVMQARMKSCKNCKSEYGYGQCKNEHREDCHFTNGLKYWEWKE